MIPADPLKSLLLEAYKPCRFMPKINIGKVPSGKFALDSVPKCPQAQWEPDEGHIPRGYLGATGSVEDVELVMVFAEPGHPHNDESYNESLGPEGLMSACTAHVYKCFKRDRDLFHRNVRWFMSQLFPEMDFDQQLQRVWLTEGRLCSIYDEIGNTKDRICAENYLVKQVNLLPNATVVAFGGKAQYYLKGIGIDYIGAYALAPPGANHKPARPSWEAAIDKIKRRRLSI